MHRKRQEAARGGYHKATKEDQEITGSRRTTADRGKGSGSKRHAK